MPLNKNAGYRYRLIDYCLSNKYRRWKYKDLLNYISKKVALEFDIDKGISKRTFDYDIQLMRKDPPEGFGAPIIRQNEEIYYSDPDFTISQQPLREEEKDQLKEAFSALSRFKGLPQFEWIQDLETKLDLGLQAMEYEIIQFDSNPDLKGREHLGKLFEAIRMKDSLKIEYQSFKYDSSEDFMFSPYFLKEYNNRWFLFGWRKGYDFLNNLALDRILKINTSSIPFIENKQIDFNHYFDDIIGVSLDSRLAKEKIVIKVSSEMYPYVETKPIHTSQEKICSDQESTTISIEVISNFELFKSLFALGEFIEVLSPPELREKMAEKIRILYSKYDRSS